MPKLSLLTAAFTQVSTVRAAGGEAKAPADRFFMKTAVRLHRAGEGAPCTGLELGGTARGPAIPAAEQALATGKVEPLAEFLSAEIEHDVRERLAHAAGDGLKEPTDAAEVPAAREPVRGVIGFIGYVEAIGRRKAAAVRRGRLAPRPADIRSAAEPILGRQVRGSRVGACERAAL